MPEVLFKIRSVPKKGFWRCGTHFSKDGKVIERDDFTEKQWERLRAEKNLHVEPYDGEPPEEVDSERYDLIWSLVQQLAPNDFQRDGKPKVKALNEALGDEGNEITAKERNKIWVDMLAAGFEPAPAND